MSPSPSGRRARAAAEAPGRTPADPLHLQVRTLAEQYVRQASVHFGRCLPIPEIRFDLRGACAGQAVFRLTRMRTPATQCALRFNDALLHRYPEEFFGQVVAHEVAHAVAHWIYGRQIRPHGPEWRAIMQEVLGVPPQVRHRMEVQRQPRRRHAYGCGCERRVHALSGIRHNRVQRREQIYLCRDCRQPLRYLGHPAD